MNNLVLLLLEDLESENCSVRCDALRQLSEMDLDDAVFKKVSSMASDPDQDPEIQFLARQAVLNVERRKKSGRSSFSRVSRPG